MFYDKKCESTENIIFGWFDFKGYALDGQLYNVSAFPIVDGKMYHVSLVIPYKNMQEWKIVMHQILLSMKDLTKQSKI